MTMITYVHIPIDNEVTHTEDNSIATLTVKEHATQQQQSSYDRYRDLSSAPLVRYIRYYYCLLLRGQCWLTYHSALLSTIISLTIIFNLMQKCILNY